MWSCSLIYNMGLIPKRRARVWPGSFVISGCVIGVCKHYRLRLFNKIIIVAFEYVPKISFHSLCIIFRSKVEFHFTKFFFWFSCQALQGYRCNICLLSISNRLKDFIQYSSLGFAIFVHYFSAFVSILDTFRTPYSSLWAFPHKDSHLQHFLHYI